MFSSFLLRMDRYMADLDERAFEDVREWGPSRWSTAVWHAEKWYWAVRFRAWPTYTDRAGGA